MEIFNYIPIIIGIKNSDFTMILAKGTIKNINEIDIHKRLLSKLYDDHYDVAMIFSNEIFLLRAMGNINNNEIKNFITTNTTWDLLVLNPFDSALNPISSVDGYNIIKKIDNTSTFFYNQIYIASYRFMQKIKNNNISIIESYVYTDPFLQYMQSTKTINLYTVGIITNITTLKTDNIIYSWNEIII
jgi:hypothetical protein